MSSRNFAVSGIDRGADLRQVRGPFDIIGDVHGCADELIELLQALSYTVSLEPGPNGAVAQVVPPAGRRAIFVGDLVDRGPRSPDALRIAMSMVAHGDALCVPGNHDAKFLRWLQGRNPRPTHGLDTTLAQMAAEPPQFHDAVRSFIEGLPTHLWLDGGDLVVAHAGIRESMFGFASGGIREFCLYGDTDGTGDDGLPIRYHWAAGYTGSARIVYGHTPVENAVWFNNTLCIDTGCCFGGRLTALRWPELDIATVPARTMHAERRRRFGHPPLRQT